MYGSIGQCDRYCQIASISAILGLVATTAIAQDRGSPGDGGQTANRPLVQAHAHNDYYHDRPLLDALDRGFCSVEADVFLVHGELLVGHSVFELQPERTLQSLYLQPLRERIGENQGRVHANGPPFTLLIDFKSDGPRTYAALKPLLDEYKDILLAVKDGQMQPGAVQVVISGDRPFDEIAADEVRYAVIDGRLSDLQGDVPSHLVPLISDNWTSHFSWRGRDDFPPAERKKLHDVVRRAHQQDRRVRFWATPESPHLWQELLDASVDLIGTDDLDRLAKFLHRQ